MINSHKFSYLRRIICDRLNELNSGITGRYMRLEPHLTGSRNQSEPLITADIISSKGLNLFILATTHLVVETYKGIIVKK